MFHQKMEDACHLLNILAFLSQDTARRHRPDRVPIAWVDVAALRQNRSHKLKRLRHQRSTLILVCPQQGEVDLRHDLWGRLVMRYEISDHHVGRMLVDNVLQADVSPSEFDKILSRILQYGMVVLNEHG